MSQYHVQLAIEYFQARALAERTEETLRGIVQFVCESYALGATEEADAQVAALELATHRGLLRP